MYHSRLPAITLLIFTISGCADMSLAKAYNSVGETLSGQRVERTEDSMASWVGGDIDQLIASWGNPSSVHTNKDNSKIYDYSYTVTKTRAATYNQYGQLLTSGESYSTTCERAFLVNSKGIITKWKVANSQHCEYTGRKISKDIPIPTPTF